MEKPNFPRRFYTRGAEPEPQKSISYSSNEKNLFAAVKKLLGESEWEMLKDSPVGVFLKFHDLKFEWSSKVVHTMLTYQLECKKKYEIWSAVGVKPLRFSLHEFEHLTGLNCDYVEDLDDPKVEVTPEVREFWEKLGVVVEAGPSQNELREACKWATVWPMEDKRRLAYLAIYAGFIAARKSSSHTPVNLARLVMDEDKFESYPWGRVAFRNLMEAIKRAELWKSGYVMDGFVEVLQVWAYRFMPEFGVNCGAPIPNAPNTPLLAYKGIQGLRNIDLTILKQVNFEHCIMVERDLVYPKWDDDEHDPNVENLIKALYGELGGLWKWKPADWNLEGVLVAKNAKSGESAKRKRTADHLQELQKRQCPESVSVADEGFNRFEEKMKELFASCMNTLTAEMKLGFKQTDVKLRTLTKKVVRIEETIREMKEAARPEEREESEEPVELQKPQETAKTVEPVETAEDAEDAEPEEHAELEEKVDDNTSTPKSNLPDTATVAKNKDLVSTDPSPKSSSRKKNVAAKSPAPGRVLRVRRRNKKYL